MPRIDLTKQAAGFLKSLPAKQARQVAERLLALESEPEPPNSQLLKGYAPMRRLKIGEFRAIYVVDGDIIQVRLIGKRNDDDIYRALERMTR